MLAIVPPAPRRSWHRGSADEPRLGNETNEDIMRNLQIEQTSIHALKPHDRNARTHSRRQIRQPANAMERFGFCNPVIIDDDQKILAGHARVKAAELLGHTSVPTVRLSHLSDGEKRAYILADNRLAEKSGWDRSLLVLELQGLI